MTIAAADVRPGKCFLSQGGKPQVVRVLSVRDGLARFEARQRRRTWTGPGETAMLKFVSGLLKEVGSDYEPDLGRPDAS